MVFLELERQSSEIFYFEEEKECDFILKDSYDNFVPYQVTYELKKENEEREIIGLINTCKRLSIKKGTILTYDQQDNRKIEGINIKIIPVWQWICLNKFNKRR